MVSHNLALDEIARMMRACETPLQRFMREQRERGRRFELRVVDDAWFTDQGAAAYAFDGALLGDSTRYAVAPQGVVDAIRSAEPGISDQGIAALITMRAEQQRMARQES